MVELRKKGGQQKKDGFEIGEENYFFCHRLSLLCLLSLCCLCCLWCTDHAEENPPQPPRRREKTPVGLVFSRPLPVGHTLLSSFMMN